MQKTLLRTALAATAAIAATTLLAAPAQADPVTDPQTGLTFYAGQFGSPLANFPDPDGTCTPFPAGAGSLIGWSNVQQVTAYATADCTGQATNLGTLRTFAVGRFAAFVAS